MTYEGRERFLSGIRRASTDVISREIWRLLSNEGPSVLLIDKLCDRTVYGCHTVRQTIQFLERFGKLQKVNAIYELNPAMFGVAYRRRLQVMNSDRLVRSM